jgi:DNA/RNA endonuclease G (NUC1)
LNNRIHNRWLKKTLLSLMLFLPVVAHAQGNENCANAVFAQPVFNDKTVQSRLQWLCESSYVSAFDPGTQNTLWSEEELKAGNIVAHRANDYELNPKINELNQVHFEDYDSSGFIIGQILDATDDNNNPSRFYLTNTFGEVASNLSIWKEINNTAQAYAKDRGEVIIISGVIYMNGHAEFMGTGSFVDKGKIVDHRLIAVPTHLYKIIIDPHNGETLAFLMPNTQIISKESPRLQQGVANHEQTLPSHAYHCDGKACTAADFIVPVSQIEKLAGIRFFPQHPELEQQLSHAWKIKGY